MPPKAVVSREDILHAGVQLVRECGLERVNARSLAKALGCSTQPIFRVYKNMDALFADLRGAMDAVYDAFMSARMRGENRLLTQSIAYVAFARQERHIFNALFMHMTMAGATLEDILAAPWNRESIENAARVTGLGIKEAETLFLHVWLYSHGVATQIVSNQIDLPQERVEQLMAEVFWKFAGEKERHHVTE